MILSLTVKTNARKTEVTKQPDGSYKVSVNAPPIEGRANEAIIEALAEHFSVPKSRIQILRGERGKKKVVELV
ncbi:MAG: DUF167 domain-containing protein [Deltaproteobacteria bacterium]|nr:DUF167 domain-containing protein [Deltaproteobacteria bacterium]